MGSRRLPVLVRAGFVFIAVGLLVDVAHHVVGVGHLGHPSVAFAGHLLTLAGMVASLGGVIGFATGEARRGKQKGGTDGVRRSTAAAR